jgi:hypothetical protein
MPLNALRAKYPWPTERPGVPEKRVPGGGIFGWFHGENQVILETLLTPETKLVVELGAFLGLSTWHLAKWAPNATIITVDHWKGSAEHQNKKAYGDVLDKLFEVFCVHLWEFRDRVIPMRTTTLEGLLELRDVLPKGPEVLYIDAGHETGPVYADTMLGMTIWPDAHIVGDDGCWTSIIEAHKNLRPMLAPGRELFCNHVCWEIPPRGVARTWEKPS